MKRQRGSLTLFALISLLLISATMFALLEATRYQELNRFADLRTMTALESVFANYNSCLWENYHLLGTDITEAEKIFAQYALEQKKGENNWLQMNGGNVMVDRYMRLTDGGGMVFLQSVSTYMKDNLLYESVKELYSQYESVKTLMENNQMKLESIDGAIESIKDADSKENQNSYGTAGESEFNILESLEKIKNLQEKGILELVLEDTKVVSDVKVDFADGVIKRKLQVGNMQIHAERNWMDRILLQQYLSTYLSNYRENLSRRALSYEIEYLLGKQSSDVANLRSVVGRILAIREAANFLYLVSCPEKIAKADALVMVYLGATLNPVLLQAVKVGLLTAWAFAESILDVRALLAGKKVSLLKSDYTWTSDLDSIGVLTDGFAMAKESDLGLTYAGYLGILLLFEQEQELAMRTLNLQEASIRKNYGDDDFRIDTLVTQAEAYILYRYKPIFPFLHVVNAEDRWNYRLRGKASYNYY